MSLLKSAPLHRIIMWIKGNRGWNYFVEHKVLHYIVGRCGTRGGGRELTAKYLLNWMPRTRPFFSVGSKLCDSWFVGQKETLENNFVGEKAEINKDYSLNATPSIFHRNSCQDLHWKPAFFSGVHSNRIASSCWGTFQRVMVVLMNMIEGKRHIDTSGCSYQECRIPSGTEY